MDFSPCFCLCNSTFSREIFFIKSEMRPFNKREGKKKPGQPRDGGDTGVFLMGYLVAYSSSEEKKKVLEVPKAGELKM